MPFFAEAAFLHATLRTRAVVGKQWFKHALACVDERVLG